MPRTMLNGVSFNYESDGDGFPLVLLHGFTGSASTWRPLVAACPGFRTIAVDLIGHGATESPRHEARYTMEHCTADLVGLLDALRVDRAAVLGYSMGGRVALQLALTAPERVAALILVSAATGVEDADERRARVASDRALADDIERDGVEVFVDRWEQLPMWATQARLPAPAHAALREQRLRSSTVGLANSLRGMGAGAQGPVLDRVRQLRMPVLLVAGQEDAKYQAIARAIHERIPGSRAAVIEGAGHAVHLEQPAAFVLSVKEFLSSCLSPSHPRA